MTRVLAAGAATELVMAKDLRVGFCKGCYTCWTTTPGRCCQDDDMNCGFPDRVHFEPLVEQFRHLTAGGRSLARPEPSSRDTSRPGE